MYLIRNHLIEVTFLGDFSIKTNICNNGNNAIEVKEECSPYEEDDWWTVISIYSKRQIKGFHYVIE